MNPWRDDDFQALAPYESNFERMARSRWCPYPGRKGLQLMHEVEERLLGKSTPFNASCSNCANKLVDRIGRAWLEEKARRTKQ